MAIFSPAVRDLGQSASVADLCRARWKGQASARLDRPSRAWCIQCRREQLIQVCDWLSRDLGYAFATLITEEAPGCGWSLRYVLYKAADPPWVHVVLDLDDRETRVPSIVGLVNGPSADWHEREVEDLFGLTFEGHPRLGEFVLHEDWPEGVNPMRHAFDARQCACERQSEPRWEVPTVVSAPGAFAMPVGPIFSHFAESAHFLLETVGEDVIRTIPRFFYKYRGVEKIAEGLPVHRAFLLAERFSGIAALAHGIAFCQAVEAICHAEVPPRALALRTVFAELERLRSHAAVITGICNSTALSVAASQAALIEEDLLRLSCEMAGHRYLFGLIIPGGLTRDLTGDQSLRLATAAGVTAARLRDLRAMLGYSSSFLDRLEGVGTVTTENAISYGLVGPIARASGIGCDMRKVAPYAGYRDIDFAVPVECEGDGYARLRVLFREAEQSAAIIRDLLLSPPHGPICVDGIVWRAGAALVAIEAPPGAAFHWLRLDDTGAVLRYRVTPPSFANWHGFHLAAESFAFQDFPIILASFGLSNAECDR